MFVNRLIINLELKIGKKSLKVPCGNIKNFNLDINSYGFKCSLDFWISQEDKKDLIFLEFVKKDLIIVNVSIDRFFDKGDEEADPMKFSGIVTEKKNA